MREETFTITRIKFCCYVIVISMINNINIINNINNINIIYIINFINIIIIHVRHLTRYSQTYKHEFLSNVEERCNPKVTYVMDPYKKYKITLVYLQVYFKKNMPFL